MPTRLAAALLLALLPVAAAHGNTGFSSLQAAGTLDGTFATCAIPNADPCPLAEAGSMDMEVVYNVSQSWTCDGKGHSHSSVTGGTFEGEYARVGSEPVQVSGILSGSTAAFEVDGIDYVGTYEVTVDHGSPPSIGWSGPMTFDVEGENLLGGSFRFSGSGIGLSDYIQETLASCT